MLSAEQRKEKRRLIRRIIIFCLLLIPVLGYVQYKLLGGEFLLKPRVDTAIYFALINLNAFLLLIMLYMVLRQLAELFFERRHQLFASCLWRFWLYSFACFSIRYSMAFC